MKVWGIPVKLPDPKEEPKQAQAVMRFLWSANGFCGFCPHESGNTLLVFQSIASARTAKWRMEEFTDEPLVIMEGTLSDDLKTLDCKKVLKNE